MRKMLSAVLILILIMTAPAYAVQAIDFEDALVTAYSTNNITPETTVTAATTLYSASGMTDVLLFNDNSGNVTSIMTTCTFSGNMTDDSAYNNGYTIGQSAGCIYTAAFLAYYNNDLSAAGQNVTAFTNEANEIFTGLGYPMNNFDSITLPYSGTVATSYGDFTVELVQDSNGYTLTYTFTPNF